MKLTAPRAPSDITTPSQPAKTFNQRRGHSVPALILIFTLGILGIVALTSLGIWQLERRAWKLDLIDRVESRIHAAPLDAPPPSKWPAINAQDAYLHVSATGHFLNNDETLVQASTELGSGYWLLTPFRTNSGFTVLVNRGFVPADWRETSRRVAARVEGEVTVTGLLRTNEPGGSFLRSNEPAQERWFSRDVDAIATARNLRTIAPYFIDADAGASINALPRGGLTVVTFPNNHLLYAVIWFSLALMMAVWIGMIAREEWTVRRTT